jgi:thiamine transport system substrate-binding protein
MKKMILVLFVSLIFLFGCIQEKEQKENVLTIYAYDSMVSEYGLGTKVIPKFEKECNCKVKMVSKGDAGQVLTTLVLEKNNPKADVVIGIDNSMLSKAIESNVLEKFTPQNIGLVSEEIKFNSQSYLTPYDYGFIAFMYDSKKIDFELNNFNSMLDSRLEKKIAIQHPRTSSPGLALLLWTVKVYGDPGYKEFWKAFKPNVLIVTDGWDESAGLFRTGEVPVYLSYATSPPYYFEFEGINHFLAAEFEEGHYIQIEGIGIVKGTKNRKLAEQFIEFSLTEEFQKEIPFTQFMFPVNEKVELPEAFNYAVNPLKKLELDPKLVEEKQEEWIKEWEKIMSS